jgi:hypothetical protein
MRRVPRPHPSQLTLHLSPEPEAASLLKAEGPTLVQALADLLLSALGQTAPGIRTREATSLGEGGDEPEDHP